ncbi:MAG: Hsp20/alpha crystallin family protein [Candidatus Eisenbacteria bacterium]|nr:Hsp20/alpha crystallin family protein [Candidatus Eisenbacteria bacterium]
MALVRWNPWGDVFSVQKEVNDLIHGFLSDDDRTGLPAQKGMVLWGPFVDVSETDEDFVVRAELPGIRQDDVKVSVDSNTLTIKGEKKLVKEEKEKTFHRMERSYGMFERTFSLSNRVDSTKAKASFKDGVLEIRLPKVGEAKTKEIPIDTN